MTCCEDHGVGDIWRVEVRREEDASALPCPACAFHTHDPTRRAAPLPCLGFFDQTPNITFQSFLLFFLDTYMHARIHARAQSLHITRD